MKSTRNPVGWFEIYVQDMAKCRRFYQEVFGVSLQKLDSPPGMDLEMWAFPMEMDLPGAPGALIRMPGKDSGGGGTIIYFSCLNCAEQATRAANHGGTIHQEKSSIGDYGFMALVVDPDGNMIGLHSLQ
ncbi:MAG: VOC family protein [Verrucomicrobiota bacterium]